MISLHNPYSFTHGQIVFKPALHENKPTPHLIIPKRKLHFLSPSYGGCQNHFCFLSVSAAAPSRPLALILFSFMKNKCTSEVCWYSALLTQTLKEPCFSGYDATEWQVWTVPRRFLKTPFLFLLLGVVSFQLQEIGCFFFLREYLTCGEFLMDPSV